MTHKGRQKCVSVGGLQGKESNKFPRESAGRVPRCRKLRSVWFLFFFCCIYKTQHGLDWETVSQSTVGLKSVITSSAQISGFDSVFWFFVFYLNFLFKVDYPNQSIYWITCHGLTVVTLRSRRLITCLSQGHRMASLIYSGQKVTQRSHRMSYQEIITDRFLSGLD